MKDVSFPMQNKATQNVTVDLTEVDKKLKTQAVFYTLQARNYLHQTASQLAAFLKHLSHEIKIVLHIKF